MATLTTYRTTDSQELGPGSNLTATVGNKRDALSRQVNAYCDQHGWDRHSPLDLVKVVEAWGCQNNLQP